MIIIIIQMLWSHIMMITIVMIIKRLPWSSLSWCWWWSSLKKMVMINDDTMLQVGNISQAFALITYGSAFMHGRSSWCWWWWYIYNGGVYLCMFVTKVIIFKWPVVTSWIADDDDIYIMVECRPNCTGSLFPPTALPLATDWELIMIMMNVDCHNEDDWQWMWSFNICWFRFAILAVSLSN